jgi:hypothetical protein
VARPPTIAGVPVAGVTGQADRSLAAAAPASPKISLRRSMTPTASNTEASMLTPIDT